MTPSEREPEHGEEPVIRDKRRIDPTTGQARVAPADVEEPTSADGSATEAGDVAGPAASEELAAARAEVLDLQDQLARAKADQYNLDQRYTAFVRRSKGEVAAERDRGVADVVEALVPVLDDMELARQHGELTGPFAAIADKLEQILGSRFSVARFGEQGEEFDPAQHEALMHSTDAGAETTSVSTVLQPGYRIGERVLRPARVAVVGPE